ncbi:MAG TPA: response regulator [Elusimicrobiota bacterium]|nr:response regulator [Elusimicrobiota bacterium]
MSRPVAHILVVDDDRDNGEFLRDELSLDRCSVTWVRDPREALKIAKRHRYQVGILDLKMPHMDGVELYHRLRDIDPDIGLIILTGYPSVDTALATLKTGAYDYVRKPYEIDELRRIVQRLLKDKGYLLETEEVINQSIGRRIKEYRQRRQLTIAELAAKTDLSKSLISQIENAKNSASLITLAKIARSLGVKPKDIVQDL